MGQNEIQKWAHAYGSLPQTSFLKSNVYVGKKKKHLEYLFILHTINSRWIKDVNVKKRPLEGNTENTYLMLGIENVFFKENRMTVNEARNN